MILSRKWRKFPKYVKEIFRLHDGKPASGDRQRIRRSFTFLNPGGVTWNGVYVNPYQANNNTNPQNNPLTIYCDDWNTDFSGTPTWNANVYALTAANVPNFKYGTYDAQLQRDSGRGPAHTELRRLSAAPAPFTRYLEAAYLDQQFENEQLSGDSDAAQADAAEES